MIKFNFIKKGVSLMLLVVLGMFVGSMFLESHAGVVNSKYINDSFDDGLNEDNWQVVGDPLETIGFAGDAGTLRYVNVAGAEEAMVTTDPLTAGEGVTGYSVEFDFKYLSNDWGDWFAFAFNKTSAVKGLDWGKGGYLMARVSSLQTNNPADSVDGLSSVVPNALTTFEEMTPTLANIANQNVRFKFVYTNENQNLDMYYDLVSESMDMTTLRNSFTFGSLTDEEDYHFAIVSSGKGLYELDNLLINQLTATDPIVYVDEDFESKVLPEEVTLLVDTAFSHGPAMALEFDSVEENARFLTKNAFVKDANVDTALMLSYEQQIEALEVDNKFGFIYGLTTTDAALTDEGVVYVYFVNRVVEAVESTYYGVTMGNGTEAVSLVAETMLPANLSGAGLKDMEISFNAFNMVNVTFDDSVEFSFTGSSDIGYFGFISAGTNHALIDNFESKAYTFYDQSLSPDLSENFNTGYLDESKWELYNYRDLRPGSEVPLFPTAKGIYVEDGKLVFDVAGESARLLTVNDYSDVEVRFTLEDYGVPTTPTNVDGEIDGVEVPPTYYLAISFGYESTEQNFWNVPTLIIQARDGGQVMYALNMNDATVYAINQQLLLSSEANMDETFEFKVRANNGNVDIWMKRASDPIALFDGEPTLSYYDVNTVGKVALASSASGSFKLDDLSISKIGGSFDQPIIEDSINPEKLIAPVVTLDSTSPVSFEQNSDQTVDFKTYFSITDNDVVVPVTDEMLNLGGFDLTKTGVYTIELTVTDTDGNEAKEAVTVAVYPEVIVPEEQANAVVASIITGVLAASVSAGVMFFILKKTKKF